ncbi:MAG: O-antigen ligase family protein [Solirubrobacteraceae bacterium]|nr:O-antigen ligase family protein [Solirubrobacteraceae bacterium]
MAAEPRGPGRRRSALAGDLPWVVLVAGLLVWVTLNAKVGQSVSTLGPTLLVVTIVAGVVGLLAVLRAPARSRAWGAGTLAAAAGTVVFAGLSITWSVDPDQSWTETNRTIAYVAVMAAGAAAARWAPRRWQAPLGGVLLGCTALVVLGLLYKALPTVFDPERVFARLQEPVGYWNAVGAISAFALVLAPWLGTRRTGYRPLNALAYPVAALAVVGLLQSYSRASLLAAGIGLAAWLALAPRRLHSLVVLAVGVSAGAFVGVWAYAQPALSTDAVLLVARKPAGTELGVLLVGMVVMTTLIGLAIGFVTVFGGIGRADRRRLGVTVACLLALVPVAGIGVLATSERGLVGTIERAYDQLTDPEASIPGAEASRFTNTGSARSSYWRQAWDVYRAQPTHGVGAGGFGAVQSRVRDDDQVARHAHGWIPQTLADAGWTGMALQLLLALAWLAAATRAAALWGPLRGSPSTPERDGTIAAIAIVMTFAVASAADWNWFIPAVALPMLLLAGWVVGRGAEAATEPADVDARGVDRRPPPLAVESTRTALAAGVAIVTVVAVVSIIQPWRAHKAVEATYRAVGDGDLDAAADHARRARDLNPLAAEGDYAEARVLIARKDLDGARAAFDRAWRRQPSVPDPYERLAEFELSVADRPYHAQRAAGIALRLAPTRRTAQVIAVAAARRSAEKRAARAERRESADR